MTGPDHVHAHRPALTQAADDLKDAAGRMNQDRAFLERRVEELLTSGWQGAAAAGFRDGWATWCIGMKDVEEGLAAMSELVGATEVEFGETDAENDAQIRRVASRIVERLG